MRNRIFIALVLALGSVPVEAGFGWCPLARLRRGPVPQYLRSNPKLAALMAEYQLTPDTIVYRATKTNHMVNEGGENVFNPGYVFRDEAGNFFTRGNPDAHGLARNIYSDNQVIAARELGPTLNVALRQQSAEGYLRTGFSNNDVLIAIRLGDVLEQGGLIYPDEGPGGRHLEGGALILSLPEDALVPARITEARNPDTIRPDTADSTWWPRPPESPFSP